VEVKTVTAGLLLGFFDPARIHAAWNSASGGPDSWRRVMRRCGQTKFNDRDPERRRDVLNQQGVVVYKDKLM
jgi:alkylated DNA nucleotide flippase Atl1